jgi:hypothetical protein
LKRKIEFREDFENNVSPERKRRRYKNANEEINELSWTRFKDGTYSVKD